MINRSEVQRRDQVLRAYFQGRDWDENKEYALKRNLVLHSSELLPDYPYLFDDEWEVEANRTQDGKGDLVFTDGEGRYAVVEVKWLDLDNSGKTVRTSRTKKRQKVQDQAVIYADELRQKLGDSVQVNAYCFTNEYDRPQLVPTL
jgi:hypothetical protein